MTVMYSNKSQGNSSMGSFTPGSRPMIETARGMGGIDQDIAYVSGFKPEVDSRRWRREEYFVCKDIPDDLDVRFAPRSSVKSNPECIQLIAIAVLIDKVGKRVLTVRKNASKASSVELGSSLPWAGGHITRADASYSHESLKAMAARAVERELTEELGIYVKIDDAHPMCLYSYANPSSARHLAICFVIDASHVFFDLGKRPYLIDEGTVVYSSQFSLGPELVKTQMVPVDLLLSSDDYRLEEWGELIAHNVLNAMAPPPISLAIDSRELLLKNVYWGDLINRYELVMNDDGSPAELGRGGTGIVVKVRQRLTGDMTVVRALKVFLYEVRLADDEGTPISRAGFDRETATAVRLSHPRIVAAYDAGVVRVTDMMGGLQQVPYTVMELMEGGSMASLLESRDPNDLLNMIPCEEHLFDIADQLMDAIEYLHSHHFYHCDIAPKNIYFKDTGNRSTLVLGDLGAGMTIDDDARERYSRSGIRVIGTRSYAPEAVGQLLGRVVAFDELAALQPAWDIFAAVKTLHELSNRVSLALAWKGRPHASADSLRDYLHGLDCAAMTLIELRQGMRHRRPDQRIVAEVPELSESSDQTLSRSMPLGPVVVSERVLSIIDNPSFLRLQHIPQLLQSEDALPGMSHSRLEHSLGTYELMRRTIIALLRKSEFVTLLDRSTIECALVSALLVNLGRFPYWHAFDEVRRSRSGESMLSGCSDDVLFKRIIKHEDRNRGWERLSDVVGRAFTQVSLEEVCDIICGAGSLSTKGSLIHSLISGTIGVRMRDHLARDSYYLGESRAFVQASLADHYGWIDEGLVLKESGLVLAEQVVAQRYWLYGTAYWSSASRLRSCILIHALRQLNGSDVEHSLIPRVVELDTSDTIGLVSDVALSWGQSEISTFLEENLGRSAPGFVTLWSTCEASERLAGRSSVAKFFSRYARESIAWKNSIREELQRKVFEVIGEHPNGIALLLDIPDVYLPPVGGDVTILTGEGETVLLPERSGLVRGIGTSFDAEMRKLRIFVGASYIKMLDNPKTKQRMQAVLIDTLSAWGE